MKEKFKPLFEPFQFRNGIDVKNRIVMGPTTNFSSHPDGTVTDEEVNYYTRRAHGVGMLITACAYVTPNGKVKGSMVNLVLIQMECFQV